MNKAKNWADYEERLGWVLKRNGVLNPKYPEEVDNLMCSLDSEGHVAIKKRRRYSVKKLSPKLDKSLTLYSSINRVITETMG